MFAIQSTSVQCTEFDAPQADRFTADSYTSLRQDIFDISIAEIEAIVEPDGIADDVWGEPEAFVCVHGKILAISGS